MIDVSVVIPTFRRRELLLEAIQSVLRQPGVSVEIIVVDDSPEGSARDTVASVRDRRVHYFKSPSPSGGKPALVRNYGASKANGRYVHFLDDDDIVADGYYRDAIALFDAHPDCGVVFGRIQPFSRPHSAALDHERAFFNRAARRTRFWSGLSSRWALTASLLFLETLLVNSACMIRRKHVESLGGYDAQIHLTEDVDSRTRGWRGRRSRHPR